ncbi:MAG: lysine--tRNA ligase [Egibacteraceae bacterium]
MFWSDELVADLTGSQTINDSKTPSGRVHVGALRGVLIHDAVLRSLASRQLPARYLFGVDDYDPLDELPPGDSAHLVAYLGVPLANVPAPPGSAASDLAEHNIGEFFQVFRELDVAAETYRMRDFYRGGRLNEAIDVILRHSDRIRQIYRSVGNSNPPDEWHPLQVICEHCGRIGTTLVTSYDGSVVTYRCLPDLVKWAQGCGRHGTISPFDGRAKLPWKLEWVAKWHVFPVTIEGAGKDHNTKGGSRDVAAACLRAVFNEEPPLNIPYEFFLVGGAKMSSSRGVGASARDIADLLPPEVLRFLMIRTAPSRTVNFSPTQDRIITLYRDYDRYREWALQENVEHSNARRVYDLSRVADSPRPQFTISFDLLLSILQLPHLDVFSEAAKLKGAPLDTDEVRDLEYRRSSALHWLEHYADDTDRIRVQESLPESAAALTHAQRAFLQKLAQSLAAVEWSADALQAAIFDAARLTPLPQGSAFRAMYRVLLDRDSGPRAGNLLAFLDRSFVISRFESLPFSTVEYWRESLSGEDAFERWLTQNLSGITSMSALLDADGGLMVIEFTIVMDDGKTLLHRVLLSAADERHADAYVARLIAAYDPPFVEQPSGNVPWRTLSPS